MKSKRRKTSPGILILLCLTASFIYGQGFDVSKRVILTFETGNWQPHSLNDEPRFHTFGEAGATPYFGFGLTMPIGGNSGLRFSIGCWSVQELEEVEHVHSLDLYPFSLDLKYWFGPDYPLTAYVIYGVGVYWGVENDAALRKARSGWGARLGAGTELVLFKRVGAGLSFEYLYVNFTDNLGGVKDFSGPKITLTFFTVL